MSSFKDVRVKREVVKEKLLEAVKVLDPDGIVDGEEYTENTLANNYICTVNEEQCLIRVNYVDKDNITLTYSTGGNPELSLKVCKKFLALKDKEAKNNNSSDSKHDFKDSFSKVQEILNEVDETETKSITTIHDRIGRMFHFLFDKEDQENITKFYCDLITAYGYKFIKVFFKAMEVQFNDDFFYWSDLAKSFIAPLLGKNNSGEKLKQLYMLLSNHQKLELSREYKMNYNYEVYINYRSKYVSKVIDLIDSLKKEISREL